ncbi:MAG: TetR/AcrR family transcriptional regulator [Sphingomonadales bacterium]
MKDQKLDPEASWPRPIDRKLAWASPASWILEPQQARSRDKLRRIMDAALELFTAKGYDNASMAEIAAAAGIAAGSIYRRFPDKQALLYAVLASYFRARAADVDRFFGENAASLTTPGDVVEFYIRLMFSSRRNDRAILRLFERSALFDPVACEMAAAANRYTAEAAAALLAERWPDGPPDMAQTIFRIHTVIRGTVVLMVLGDHAPSWPPLSVDDPGFEDDLIDMALHWLGLPPMDRGRRG